MIDSDEKLRRVHPFFAYYIADWPEGCRVTLTMDGKLTKKPCHGCLIDCTNLGKLKNEARNATVRTHESVMNLHRQALNALNKTEKKGIARDHSFHPYENFFWRLPGCNIYLHVSPDLFHQYFLGMVKAYLESFLSYLSEFANGKDFIKRFDDIFRSFPNWRECRTFKNGVSGLNFVTADTMKEILFKLPLAVYGLRLNNKAFHELAVEMLSWYQNITTGELTLEFLCYLQKQEDKIGALIEKCGFSSKFVTVKNHYMLHYTPFVMMFEDPDTFSTQTGEMAHKKKVKLHFEKSNKKSAEKFMVKKER